MIPKNFNIVSRVIFNLTSWICHHHQLSHLRCGIESTSTRAVFIQVSCICNLIYIIVIRKLMYTRVTWSYI